MMPFTALSSSSRESMWCAALALLLLSVHPAACTAQVASAHGPRAAAAGGSTVVTICRAVMSPDDPDVAISSACCDAQPKQQQQPLLGGTGMRAASSASLVTAEDSTCCQLEDAGNVTVCYGGDVFGETAFMLVAAPPAVSNSDGDADADEAGKQLDGAWSYRVTASVASSRGGHVVTAQLHQVIAFDRRCWDVSASCPPTLTVSEMLNATVPV